MGLKAVQVLELVVILFIAFRYFLCLDLDFKPVIYCQSIALEVLFKIEVYGKIRNLIEFSIKTFKAFLDFFAIRTYRIISLYRFNDHATGPLI